MALSDHLGFADADQIDPSRPLELCGFLLGPEAAVEAIRILQDAETPRTLKVWSQKVVAAEYFEAQGSDGSVAHIVSFPEGVFSGFATALEVALVNILHSADDTQFSSIQLGNCFACIGDTPLGDRFSILLNRFDFTDAPRITALERYRHLSPLNGGETCLSDMDISCLAGYLSASPVKYKFLELYRLMEARYLLNVQSEFNATFRTRPKEAIASAQKNLDSEAAQLALLSTNAKEHFEVIWEFVNSQKSINQFAAAILRKLDTKGGDMKSPKHRSGAALIYYVRCAIVHSGGKDMIFESYRDGSNLLEQLLEHMEEAAFALAGVRLSGK